MNASILAGYPRSQFLRVLAPCDGGQGVEFASGVGGTAEAQGQAALAASVANDPKRSYGVLEVIHNALPSCIHSALHPLKHSVEEFEPILLQIPQHVFGDRRKLRADQDVQAEWRQ